MRKASSHAQAWRQAWSPARRVRATIFSWPTAEPLGVAPGGWDADLQRRRGSRGVHVKSGSNGGGGTVTGWEAVATDRYIKVQQHLGNSLLWHSVPAHTNLVLVQSDTQRGVDGQDQVLISLSPWNRQPKAKPVSFPARQTNTLLSSLLPTSAPQLPSLPSHFSPTCQEPALSRLSPLPAVPSPSGSPPGLLPTSRSRAGGQSIPLLHCFCFILFHSFNKLPWSAFQTLSTLPVRF